MRILAYILFIICCTIFLESERIGDSVVKTYNQKKLYIKYKIDTIIEKENSETTFTIINDSGKRTKCFRYCPDGTLSFLTEYNEYEEGTKTINYSCENKNEISYQCFIEYQKGKPIRYSHNEEKGIFNTSSETSYDSLDRIKEYKTYGFGGQIDMREIYSYFPAERKRTMQRFGYDGNEIYVEITFFDNKEREIESDYNYNGYMASKYVTDYDDLGNVKRYAGYFFPGNKLEVEKLNFYSKPEKLDSVKYKSSEAEKYDITYYQYDNRGLLVKEIHHDNLNNIVNETTYEYK